MFGHRGCGAGWLVAVLVSAVVRVAAADPSAEDKALSTELFNEGRQLMAEGKLAEACAKLAESERLVHADGTLLNVAVCNEKLGKLATAYGAFIEARARARAAGRQDRVDLANQYISAIEPRLSRLTIVVSSQADVAGLRIYRDGTELGRAAWGTAMPVDPGTHSIEARAAGKRTWSYSIEVGGDADRKKVEVAVLEDDLSAEVAPPPTVVPAVVPAPPPASPGPPAPAPRTESEPELVNGRRVAAYALGIGGVVALGIGSYFGVRAFSKWSESDDECPGGRCSAKGAQASEDARRAADASTVSFVVAGACLGAGAYLFFTSEPDKRKTGALFVRAGYIGSGPRGFIGTHF